MSGIRIVVTGGRTFTAYDLVKVTLDKLHRERTIILLVHGACRGADL